MSLPRSKANRARLFFALWPDDGVRDALAAAAVAAQARAGGRAIGADKIHLTLVFVGAIDRARIPALAAAAASMRSNAFEFALDTLGYWRHNGIVWCGPARCPTALALLAADLRSALQREGVRADEHAYVPHITLVRAAARSPRDVVFAPCVWHARDFVLVESEPFEGGMRYAVRARWPL